MCKLCGVPESTNGDHCVMCRGSGVVLTDHRLLDGFLVVRGAVLTGRDSDTWIFYVAYEPLPGGVMGASHGTIGTMGTGRWWGRVNDRNHREELEHMPRGEERYRLSEQLREADSREALELINRAYPETVGLGLKYCLSNHNIHLSTDQVRAHISRSTEYQG